MNVPKMLEETEFRGFYRIPNFSNYAISKGADVLDLKFRRILKPSRAFNGYVRVTMVNDHGHRETWARHRLVGIVFIDKPEHLADYDFEQLVINHKNLTPGDDRIENLEWCTHAENSKHAVVNGELKRKILVERRDPVSGEVLLFPSLSSCAKSSNVPPSGLKWRLNESPDRVYPEGYQYRKKGDHRPWGDGSHDEFGRSKVIQVKDLITGEIHDFSSQREASVFIGVSEAAISEWLNNPSQPVVEGLKQLKRPTEEWREVKDPILDYEQFSKRRAIAVIDASTLQTTIYPFASLCASRCNIMPNLLDYRLRYKGEKVCTDGKRYLYYTDFINSKWSAAVSNPVVCSP